MELARFRKRIEDEIAALAAQGKEAAARAPVELDQQAVGRLSRMDALQVQAMAEAEEARRRRRIEALRAALKRIEDGTFGECLACGEEIAPARLEADPALTTCIDCASARR